MYQYQIRISILQKYHLNTFYKNWIIHGEPFLSDSIYGKPKQTKLGDNEEPILMHLQLVHRY